MQGVGGACLLANATPILTDAFPVNQRGTALGINNIVAVSGMFVGLVLGGILAPINWRLVFLISVPVGLFGTVWAYIKLREIIRPRPAPIDWAGNITFALGLILIMVSITYGIRPWGGHPTGWQSPRVLALMGSGLASLIAFVVIEHRSANPMFRLQLLRIRAFSFGTTSTFLSSLARGGLMFMLIIWLQGIWLPQHGYSFADTPLWAGIYMLPLTFGMLIAGPRPATFQTTSAQRLFATGGMLGAAGSFALLSALPTDFSYPEFAATLGLLGISMGLFQAPNKAAVMNSLPPHERGSGGGMNQTFQNSAQVAVGGDLLLADDHRACGQPAAHARCGTPGSRGGGGVAHRVAQAPPVTILFAAFLGYDPIQHLAGPGVLSSLSAHARATLTGRSFFPQLIAEPFRSGLHAAFAFAIVCCLIAALLSALRGATYHSSGARVA